LDTLRVFKGWLYALSVSQLSTEAEIQLEFELRC